MHPLLDQQYWIIFGKTINAFLGRKNPYFGHAEITNYCNLKCKHCYWWINRNEKMKELDEAGWKYVIENIFKKNNVTQVWVAGGEPYLRPSIVKLFSELMPKKSNVVTNGTMPIKFFKGLTIYCISIDGTREVHNAIRGPTYDQIVANVSEFVDTYGSDGKGFFTSISMTINSINYKYVNDVVREWQNLVASMVVQFHTPFSYDDSLWLPYGSERDRLIDELIKLKKEYPSFLLNPIRHIEAFRRPWGHKCANWISISVDAFGRVKYPCPMGSADPDMKSPICERCGCFSNSLVYSYGVKGNPTRDFYLYRKLPIAQ
ncbi:MAG: radical SAM protein [Nitrososphaerales archaeon]